MTKIFIFGITGRMGQEVKNIVEASDQLELVGGYSGSAPHIELDDNQKPDLVIDFSLPAAFDDLCSFIDRYQPAVVSGTTGLNDQQHTQLKERGQSVPIFWAANMSFGVHLMSQLTQTLARYDSLYKFHIEETHHIHKKDKPSGTALLIEKAAQKSTNSLDPTVSIREGEVFGVHRFIADSANELIEIKHEALNRGLFAQGAVDVGRWLVSQSPGYYGMNQFFDYLSPEKSPGPT